MADRTSAYIFGMIFNHLAGIEKIDPEELWNMRYGYDFSPYQMECDEALEKLGLSWICKKCTEDTGYRARQYGTDDICDKCGTKRGEENA